MDVTFKEGAVPSERGSIPPIRRHWINFIDRIVDAHRDRGDFVEDREKPLWQFSPSEVNGDAFDLVYVPHREAKTFSVSDPRVTVRYYMQTVFPERFYVDRLGWAGGVSTYPCFELISKGHRLLRDRDEKTLRAIGALRVRSQRNESKFEQPPLDHKIKLPSDYVFFPCQLPHDETIRSHSNWTVARALVETLESAARVGLSVVVKGHPVNPGSMIDLKNIAYKYDHATWVDDASVHQLIAGSRLVACVNSGVGLEAVVYGKPVVTFGRSDYDVVTMNVERHYDQYGEPASDALDGWLTKPHVFDEEVRMGFLAGWCDWTYDTTDVDFNSRI